MLISFYANELISIRYTNEFQYALDFYANERIIIKC